MAGNVEWELEGSAEYFEGEMTYKNGVTYAELQIDSVTDETCGTYVCTATTEETSVSHKTGKSKAENNFKRCIIFFKKLFVFSIMSVFQTSFSNYFHF